MYADTQTRQRFAKQCGPHIPFPHLKLIRQSRVSGIGRQTDIPKDRQTVTDYLQITCDGRVSGGARAAPRWFVSRVSE